MGATGVVGFRRGRPTGRLVPGFDPGGDPSLGVIVVNIVSTVPRLLGLPERRQGIAAISTVRLAVPTVQDHSAGEDAWLLLFEKRRNLDGRTGRQAMDNGRRG